MSPAASSHSWPAISSDSQSVSISQSAKIVAIAFLDESGNGTSLDFRPHHLDLSETRFDQLFVCHVTHGEPWLQFFAEPAIRTNIFLLKAIDGSLIVRWVSSSMALTMNSVWYRYPLLDSSARPPA